MASVVSVVGVVAEEGPRRRRQNGGGLEAVSSVPAATATSRCLEEPVDLALTFPSGVPTLAADAPAQAAGRPAAAAAAATAIAAVTLAEEERL